MNLRRSIQDVPRLAWVAAGVTVAAACLLAVLFSDTCHNAVRLSMTADLNGSTSTGIDGVSSPDQSPSTSSDRLEELAVAAPERASAKNCFRQLCQLLFRTCHRHMEPLLSLVVVMLCFAYSAGAYTRPHLSST